MLDAKEISEEVSSKSIEFPPYGSEMAQRELDCCLNNLDEVSSRMKVITNRLKSLNHDNDVYSVKNSTMEHSYMVRGLVNILQKELQEDLENVKKI
ncbi:hypothetical protein M5C72_02585 [Companilactobacillus allii]|uniref:Uncharacterized protein n=1 Tax=Companilactobacillus allii TaxID=1847728 RepID=A0A1P8Q2F7_9LACO|nr:hypothetical protein [Companilactobacillus allii]APX72050.1 hypothetical protein BTM29_05510 [Companilactobacillus allii]USQ69141.1 hypothetical protein M5C72_02585 [Companilactobacillus allii]